MNTIGGVQTSVYTPSHQPRWLDDCYRSLLDQGDAFTEWVVLLNGDAHWDPPADPRVHVHHTATTGIGSLKAEAISHTRGDVLVELDHDDLLLPRALATITATIDRHPDTGLVYSDTIQVAADLTNDCPDYPEAHGWEYATAYALGAPHRHPVTPAPTPHNVSLIWYAPNHVRAFTRDAYETVGGYDHTLDVLDDQDLMCRLYQHGPFRKTTAPLYVQRVHGGNTQTEPHINARIQAETWGLYERHITANSLAWANRRGLAALDLGAAHAPAPGFTPVDQNPTGGILHTFPDRLDLPDGSVGVIRAYDFLEHVPDKTTMWNELWRLLAPGGMLLTHTPSTDGRGAFQDPTHSAFYNENSLWYVTDPAYAAYVPESTARFQVSRARTWYPSVWHQEHDVSYVTANLVAVKPGMDRSCGRRLWR